MHGDFEATSPLPTAEEAEYALERGTGDGRRVTSVVPRLVRERYEPPAAGGALQLSVPEKLAGVQKRPTFSIKDRAREGHVSELVGMGGVGQTVFAAIRVW